MKDIGFIYTYSKYFLCDWFVWWKSESTEADWMADRWFSYSAEMSPSNPIRNRAARLFLRTAIHESHDMNDAGEAQGSVV
jgi:hypothetical protein